MKNINEYLNEGFFSNVGGSLSNIKKLLAPIFELNNPNRKRDLYINVISDVLTNLPKKFGFDIYKYDSDQTEIIQSFKVTKEEDDMFWVRRGGQRGGYQVSHCDTDVTTIGVYPYYFAKNPLKVVMTYDGDEVK